MLLYAVWTVGPTWVAAGLAALLAALPSETEMSRPMTRGDGLILGIVLFLAIWVASRERDQ